MKVCKKCKTALINNQWIPTKNMQEGYIYVLCPNCEKETAVEYQASLISLVLLDANYFIENKKAIMHQIYAVEKQFREAEFDAKILLVDRRSDSIIIKTSHPLLASRIGKKIHKMYRGKLNFSPNGARGVLVHWIGNTYSNRPVTLKPAIQQAAA
jgi:hypothetical protein